MHASGIHVGAEIYKERQREQADERLKQLQDEYRDALKADSSQPAAGEKNKKRQGRADFLSRLNLDGEIKSSDISQAQKNSTRRPGKPGTIRENAPWAIRSKEVNIINSSDDESDY